MADYTIVLLEASGIQEYIFGSNHLAQNIGASELVMRSTTTWVRADLNKLKLRHNIQADTAGGLLRSGKTLEDGDLDAEVVFSGGGAATLLFRDDAQAATFIQNITQRALEDAPGLKLWAARRTFPAGQGQFRETYEKLRGDMFQRKRLPYARPLPGLSVSAACVFTGLPAVGFDNDPLVAGKEVLEKPEMQRDDYVPRPISAETAARLRAESDGKKRLHELLPQVKEKGLEFVYDFDHFGSKDESSYVAVVHIDGNNMGSRFGDVGQDSHSDRDYITAVQAFSDSIQKAAETALTQTVNDLLAAYDGKDTIAGVIKLQRTPNSNRYMLPFRPLVFGGDDVTFVCDGRLGLSLATRYLEVVSQQILTDRQPLHARAGVAVVHNHYPFSRAYDLSASLAGRAKKAIAELSTDPDEGATVLDWHFAKAGLLFELSESSKREYQVQAGDLLMRPVLIRPATNNQWRTWGIFRELTRTFLNSPDWAGRRNKVLALREALRAGPDAVSQFLNNYGLPTLPDIPSMPDMRSQGWQAGRCGYFDAIEATDFFVEI